MLVADDDLVFPGELGLFQDAGALRDRYKALVSGRGFGHCDSTTCATRRVDEISYRRGMRYLTNVADHQTGGIIWSAPGRTGRTLEEFFELLGDRKDSISAVSIDMSEPYAGTIRRWLPQAEIAFDPFHVIALAGAAVDHVRREHTHAMGAYLKIGEAALFIICTYIFFLNSPSTPYPTDALTSATFCFAPEQYGSTSTPAGRCQSTRDNSTSTIPAPARSPASTLQTTNAKLYRAYLTFP